MNKRINLFYLSFLLIFCWSQISTAQLLPDDGRIKDGMRMIGHELLLMHGDSTSRVMPIEVEGGRYKISFETEFKVYPDEFVTTIHHVVLDQNLAAKYRVELLDCETNEVVYNYEIGNYTELDNIPCRTRDQPQACYYVFFTILEHSPVFNEEIDDLTEEEESGDMHMLLYGLVGILVALIFTLVYHRRKQRIDPNIIVLGQYHFDPKNMELILQESRIELSSKEADLLSLLYKHVNETLERDAILSAVWGDDGAYVGRTLDVFISKLRKKLEADPSIKIVNIRGVGYKMIINDKG